MQRSKALNLDLGLKYDCIAWGPRVGLEERQQTPAGGKHEKEKREGWKRYESEKCAAKQDHGGVGN